MRTEEFKHVLTWEEKAQQNPLYAIMTVEEFEGKGSDPTEWTDADREYFFEKGRAFYQCYFKPILKRTGANPAETSVLEYGCGAGRILNAFLEEGYDVSGVDISPTMIKLCRKMVPGVSAAYVLEEDGTYKAPSESIDLVYSYAVLQHIRRLDDVKTAIREMARVLKPGGHIKIQFYSYSLPFRRRGLTHTSWVFNGQDASLIHRWMKLAESPQWKRRFPATPDWLPAIPVVYRLKHTNWRGVPLDWRILQRWLNASGIQVLGLEKDLGTDEPTVWLVGRKGKPIGR